MKAKKEKERERERKRERKRERERERRPADGGSRFTGVEERGALKKLTEDTTVGEEEKYLADPSVRAHSVI